jgi:hypothetical protein
MSEDGPGFGPPAPEKEVLLSVTRENQALLIMDAAEDVKDFKAALAMVLGTVVGSDGKEFTDQERGLAAWLQSLFVFGPGPACPGLPASAGQGAHCDRCPR